MTGNKYSNYGWILGYNMLMAKKATKSKGSSKTSAKTAYKRRGTKLWGIGWWATAWWAVSGLYLLLLVWMAKDIYVEKAGATGSGVSIGTWLDAISLTYHSSHNLQGLFLFIMLVWIIGSVTWLAELKRHGISYKAAFKDLFLTIRN